MKWWLVARESYVGRYVNSVAPDIHGILQLVRKVKHFICVRCWWSINSFNAWGNRIGASRMKG